MPSAMTMLASATSKVSSLKKASEDPTKLLENLEISPIHLETVRLHPPEAPHNVQDYTDEMLQERRCYADHVRSDGVFRTSTLSLFAGCYSYFLTKAQRFTTEPDSSNDNDDRMIQVQRQRQQACYQVLMFDRANTAQAHPCDVANTEIGDKLLTCTSVMLKYVIYTRYQYYLGRKLNSFSFAVKPELIRIWRNAYKSLKDEMSSTDDEQRYSHIEWESEGGENLVMSDILHRLGEMLRLQRFTVENAIRSLEKYSRHRFLLWQDGCDSPEVPTYELEALVQSKSTELLAHTLYSDFVALDTMKKFVTEDVDVVHLQAVITGLIKAFFGINCVSGEHNHDISTWQPTTLLNVQEYYLNNGDRRFQQRVRWLAQSEAERAERKFWKAWTALCRDDGRNQRDVQELLRTYLKTLGVDEAQNMTSMK